MKDKSLTLASILAAGVASLCCIGPLVAVGLGVGSFGAAAWFEELRPYLLGFTALLLASTLLGATGVAMQAAGISVLLAGIALCSDGVRQRDNVRVMDSLPERSTFILHGGHLSRWDRDQFQDRSIQGLLTCVGLAHQ